MTSIINDLQNLAALPDKTERISLVQTHISIVLIADEFVYKIKKPVNFGFLDFSTLEKRKHYCHQEIALNRRLSKDIYLDVLPIVFDGRKHIQAFKVNTDENFEQVERYIGITIQQKDFHALKKWTTNFYRSNQALFSDRIKEGRIRDCHGDLHMEHICFTEPLSIIDCIEFNDRFRYSDTLADIAFLLMDLEYHKGEEYSKLFLNAYKALSGEKDVDSLLTFYKVYRAFVRGKVNSFQVDDDGIGSEKKEKAIQTARTYFKLAYCYVD